MKRDMVKLREHLATEIFSRRFAELDDAQQAFVNRHAQGYHGYVKKVAPVIRQALRRKKLHKEYGTILDLYCLRLPPEYFKSAVQAAQKKANEGDEVVYSIGYVEDHFSRYVERYKKDVVEKIEGRIEVDIDYPWFYNIFCYIRENDNFIFDPFWGFRERLSPGKGKPPVEMEIVLKMREVDTVEKMIERLLEFKGRYPKKKEKLKTLRRKKQRLQQKIRELREKVDGE